MLTGIGPESHEQLVVEYERANRVKYWWGREAGKMRKRFDELSEISKEYIEEACRTDISRKSYSIGTNCHSYLMFVIIFEGYIVMFDILNPKSFEKAKIIVDALYAGFFQFPGCGLFFFLFNFLPLF